MTKQLMISAITIYLSIAIFNMINIKHAFDEVYGAGPMSWNKLRTLVINVTCVTLKQFLMDWWMGLFSYETMVEAVRNQRKRK